MRNTKIEWTESTWNPIRGCQRVSEGCRHCYAERIAGRFSAPGQTYHGIATMKNGEPRWTGKVQFVAKHFLDPMSWHPGRMIFVNSMSDLFYREVSDAERDLIHAVIALCPHHTFQVLTKRPEEMLRYYADPKVWDRVDAAANQIYLRKNPQRTRSRRFVTGMPDNLWPGISAEDQATAEKRVPELMAVPARVRFISAEPLLGEIDFSPWLVGNLIHWIIAGGESGQDARPMDPRWARAIRDQCLRANVTFFFKQWGAWTAATEDLREKYPAAPRHRWPDGTESLRLPMSDAKTMKEAGALLDGRTWCEVPEVK